MNEQSYDKIAEWFAADRAGTPVDKHMLVFTKRLKPGAHILEVGSGGGLPITKYLTDAGFKVTGLDVSSNLVDIARRNVPEAQFIKGDILSFSPLEKFDAIVSWDCLFHLNYNHQTNAFKKLYELLKDGGNLIFSHGDTDGEITGEMNGETFYYSSLGSKKILEALNEVGFTLLSYTLDDTEEHGYIVVIAKK